MTDQAAPTPETPEPFKLAAEFCELAENVAATGDISVENYDKDISGGSVWLESSTGGIANGPFNMADYVEPTDAVFIAWCFNHRAEIAAALKHFATPAQPAPAEGSREEFEAAKANAVAEWEDRKITSILPGARGGRGYVDEDIVPLCDALNQLDGVFTLQSCAGHTAEDADGCIYPGNLWLALDPRSLEVFGRAASALAANPRVQRLEKLYWPDGRQTVSVTFDGNECGRLAESSAVLEQFFTDVSRNPAWQAAQGERAAESAAALAGKMAIEEAAKVLGDEISKLEGAISILDQQKGTDRGKLTAEQMDKARDQLCYNYRKAQDHTQDAIDAIARLSKPIDRNALIERGARALAAVIAKRHGHSVEDWMREERREEVRAILSAWIGEETK